MRLKLSTRLILNSLLLSIIPLLIVSLYGLYVSDNELENDVHEKLTLALKTKVDKITAYFELARSQLITMAKDDTIVRAIKELNTAVNSVETELGKRYDTDLAANEGLLKARYAYQESNTIDPLKDAMNLWWPKDRITRILQHYYISANPFIIDEKFKFDFSIDGSRYSQIHKHVHSILREFVEKFHYNDIFLIDASSGRILYNIKKTVDFATSLITGPYSESSIAKVFKAAMRSESANSIHFVDISPYAPYYNRHSAFIAISVLDEDGTKIGALIFQLSRRKMDYVMTDDHQWKERGMGKSGEAILVGSDYLMKSEARLLIENFNVFVEHLRETGIVTEEVRQNIEKHKTAINYLEFQSPAVDAALNGKTGTLYTNNYLQHPAIIAYAPFTFENVNWAVLSMMEKDDAFSGLNHLQTVTLSLLSVLTILAILIGWWLARSISNPITAIISILSSSSSQMAATTSEHERIASQQAASINETNTTMEELAISSKQSANQAQAASDGAQTTLSLAEEGTHQVNEMLQGMEAIRDKVNTIAQQILQLSEQISQIGTITGMMTDFANETKMLAMNAAVESVRAGEYGKGFSVLSIEIRKLAEESKRSAERINVLVEDIQKATNSTVMATEEGTKTVERTITLAHTTAGSFNSVSQSMHNVSTSAQQISLNVKQQAEAIRQVVVAMNELKIGTKESATGISQTKDGIKALNEAALKLKAIT